MSFNGFGKASGPTIRPSNSQNPFVNLVRPPSTSSTPFPNFPPPQPSPPPPPPRRPAAPERPKSLPLGSENSHSVGGLSHSSANNQRVDFPPSAWVNGQKGSVGFNNVYTYHRPSTVVPSIASQNSGTGFPANNSHFPDSKRSRSTTLMYTNSDKSGNSGQDVIGRRPGSLNNHSEIAPQKMRSPTLNFHNNHLDENICPSFGETQRPTVTSSAWNNRPRSPVNYADLSSLEEFPALPTSAVPCDSRKNWATAKDDVLLSKQMNSPSFPSSNEAVRATFRVARNVPKRTSMSSSAMVSRSNEPSHSLDPPIHQVYLPSTSNNDSEAAGIKSTSFSLPKRTRSPPSPSADRVSQQTSYLAQDETEREMQAKAKRLARFKVELTQTTPSDSDNVNHKFNGNRDFSSTMERQKYVGEHSVEGSGDFPSGSIPEYEGMESSGVIIGLCPDMCPDSERAERERKGDLDRYERVDGDRNQTSKYLAVKKYTRTAEREAVLIRPMPILQKTIDYLLSLLDQPYDETFLGMYNFLWDRMRAIRMDLRMQHIFNLGAITMLEQMIKLHIIAMHELCEYTKGEGFSEGFDAHLNIEQMNKTSVELFQLYDDHRKKGIDVPTEKEFRGYYALLKLDKHPGYKVEPAELSLDLAKMTPEIRQTQEVLFARDIARACRTSNYIAFFRLARKASYLQACLTHAHFAKLRTQALASLHSGLQNNQGIPVAQVARWLGMEDEDVESLLDYHGFSIREFEEPYMVKEGPFLNCDKDYPTKCSKLVHLKKSKNIIEDILSSSQTIPLPVEAQNKLQLNKLKKQDPPAVQIVQTDIRSHVFDEDMPDSEAVSSPKDGMQMQPMLKTSLVRQDSGASRPVASVSIPTWGFPSAYISPAYPLAEVVRTEKQDFESPFNRSPDRSLHFGLQPIPLQIVPTEALQYESPVIESNVVMTKLETQNNIAEVLESAKPQDIRREVKTDQVIESYLDKEVAEAKLKLVLRLWKRRSSNLKKLRERKLLAANAALGSLSLGPPIRQNRTAPITFSKFNIDDIMRERHEKREKSWSKLNVSEVIAGQLSKRNSEARCLCFKLIICSQMESLEADSFGHANKAPDMAAASWLVSKLIPARKDDDNDLVVSSPGLSVWKKWIRGEWDTDLSCCLSVVKDVSLDQTNETLLGASAVLFLFTPRISWELQKIRLHDLVMSLPSGSSLPLLILSGSYEENMSDSSALIFNRLGLCDIDNARISKVSIRCLVGKQEMEPLDGFFSDEQLREGLLWVASETPTQPLLCRVKTRDLVLTHLNSTLDALEKSNVYKVGPHQCISAFNEALDQSKWKIGEAANANPAGWPCPEIALLEESSDEHRACKLLPNIGWSSNAMLEPQFRALNEIKLPAFSDNISGLGTGSNMVQEIENQRTQLENCLMRYLTQSSRMMGIPEATNEACIILQRNAGLELHNSSFYICPKWVGIFRRIFNWRLESLSNGNFSDAYILEQERGAPPIETNIPSTYHLNHPSLDEMIEVGCHHLLSRMTLPKHGNNQNQVAICSNGNEIQEAANSGELIEDVGISSIDREQCGIDDGNYLDNLVPRPGELDVATTVKTEANRLSELLESCNTLQDMIDKKLSIYF